jgi:hypothetical protein
MGAACVQFAQKYAEDFCNKFEPQLQQRGFEFRLDSLLNKPVEVFYLHIWMVLTDIQFDRRLVDALYDALFDYSIQYSPSESEMEQTQEYMFAALNRRLKEYCPAFSKFMTSPGVNGIGLTQTVLENIAIAEEKENHSFDMVLHLSLNDRITWTLKHASEFRRKFQIVDSAADGEFETKKTF